jgi:hypothetical protein
MTFFTDKGNGGLGLSPFKRQQKRAWSSLVFLTWNSCTTVLVEVSGHKLESSQTRVFVWFSTLVFLLFKMSFRNRVEFMSQGIFLNGIKNQSRVWFSLTSAIRRECEYYGAKTRVVCQIHVEELHLSS